MSYNICIVKPKNNPHSDAFWEMAELLAYSLRDLNQDTSICINEILGNRKNILLGAHLLTDTNNLPSSTIIINTEEMRFGLSNNDELETEKLKWVERIVSLGKEHSIWDYSDDNIEFLNSKGCLKIKKFEFGFHEKLNRISQQKHKDIDVLFYGALTKRRNKLLIQLTEAGLKVKALFGVYGAQRDEYISRAKIVLNCHHYDTKNFEIIRVHYLLNNAVTVISEIDPETQIEPFWKDIIFGATYDEITQVCVNLAKNELERTKISELAFSKFKKRPQKDFTAKLINHQNSYID